MKGRDAVKLSVNNIVTSPMRSLLTVLGMAIGVGAILAVLTLGDAGRTQVESEMGRLGIDKVWLTASGGAMFRAGDGAVLEGLLGMETIEQAAVPMLMSCGSSTFTVTVAGCERQYFSWMNAVFTLGREWNSVERLRGSRAAIISAPLAKELGILNEYSLSSCRIDLGGVCFRLIGVADQSLSLTMQEAGHIVYLPLDVMNEIFGVGVSQIVISVGEGEEPDNVAERAVRLLQLQKGRSSSAMTMQVQIEAARSVVGTFVRVLEWVAAICMLVGGIGVMNILLVSVRERRREIGVMKSLGATSSQVCLLFLIEAVTFSVIGAILGLVFGLAIIRVAGEILLLSPEPRIRDIAIVILSALAVGLGFGVLPASRAAALTPVDALRD